MSAVVAPAAATAGLAKVARARRLAFLDGLRGVAIILMVINHTGRWWLEVSMGWPRYWLVYGSVLLPAAIFLFLVGFCLPLSFRRRAPEAGGALFLGYLQRGATIVGAGLLLNVLVFPEEPFWAGGVLQTIGLAVIACGALLPAMRWPAARLAVVVAAVLVYLAFGWANPALARWLPGHPLLAEIVFLDFPPWPWISAALIGLTLGWQWLDARAAGPAAERRFFLACALVGAAAVLAYGAWEWFVPTRPRFGFPRDWILNHHWTPRGATALLVTGGTGLLLAATWWLMEVRGLSAPWLVVLGQTALMLYFVHQVIVYTLVNRWLGVRFHDWALYAAANLVLLVALVGLGYGWLGLRRAVAARRAARSAA